MKLLCMPKMLVLSSPRAAPFVWVVLPLGQLLAVWVVVESAPENGQEMSDFVGL
jgi:hypothetical protein